MTMSLDLDLPCSCDCGLLATDGDALATVGGNCGALCQVAVRARLVVSQPGRCRAYDMES
jgi:hypothetical protein